MQSGRSRYKKFSFKLALLFVYLPFLVMQFSYKFYVIANFYYFLSHQAYVAASTGNISSAPKIAKLKAVGISHYDPSHLTLDKRYSHKVNSDEVPYYAVAPTPLYVILNTEFVVTTSSLTLASFTISSPRAPPCA